MMKNLNILAVLLVFGIFSCAEVEEEKESTQTEIKSEENLIERMPGMYREYYPGKKQLKITGPLDPENKRNGTWESFYENGQKNSATYFVNGIKNGHSIVYYPNGNVHYVGEYRKDEKAGLWKIYNEKGELISEDNF